MLTLFDTQQKVQKDRQVIKEADQELCHRSLQGSTMHLLLYVLALVVGSFYQSQPGLSLLLGGLMVALTVIRNLLLYRFDSLYPKGPSRWRNMFFFSTLLLAGLWSTILVLHLLSTGIDTAMSILWFYTAIFCCAACLVYGSFNPFYRYFIFLSVIPSAIAAMLLQTAEGFLYSALFWGFYLFLAKSGDYYEHLYWEHLSAKFALKQRTVDLDIAKKNSASSMQLKNEFLSNMSHEFRTPLNDSLGALSLLGDTGLSKDQVELLKLAEHSNESLLGLVDNILDYTKITSEAVVLDSIVFNLRRLIEQSIEDLVLSAHERQIELSYIFQREVPLRVRGDPARLGQVIYNLVSNAIKFSRSSNIIIRVSMDRRDKDYGRLRLVVEDEGSGISIDDENVVINAFSNLDTQLNKKVGGTGLGLAICKGLVDKMLGEIGFETKPDVGTIFWFEVDLLVSTNQDQAFLCNPKLKGKRLLLVNMPANLLDHYMIELKEWELEVKGIDSVDLAREELVSAVSVGRPYDLVLTNMNFDDDDTLDFSEFVATNSSLKKTFQVIAASVVQLGMDNMYEHTRRFPQCECISKPIRRVKLHEILVQLLVNGNTKHGKNNVIVPRTTSGKKKILLVEDHKVNQMITRGMLNKLGYAVKVANNGKEALGFMVQEQFDVILMDCQMPVMDGYQAAEEIRKRELNTKQHIPIIAMTAHAAEEDESRCLSAGMDDYLAKPVKLLDLRSRLEHWSRLGFSRAV